MIKGILFSFFTLCICFTASAQLQYAFKDTFTAYTPLTGATLVNGSTIWDDEAYTIPMPFPVRIDRDMKVMSMNLELGLPGLMTNNNTADMNGFFIGDMDMADRGNLTGAASKSPIRYLVTGTAPKRIFKLEFFNVGFADEMNLNRTMNDSFNMQVWIYETTNRVEYHFGPSQVSYTRDYYALRGTGPFMGYLKHMNFTTGNSGTFYYVPDTRYNMDSLVIPGFAPYDQLSYWPYNGEVFRFTPTWTSCDKPGAAFADTVSGLTRKYLYTGTLANLDSLSWDFGDGSTQLVTKNYRDTVAHLYINAGHYNARVTAYSDCGNDTSTSKQSAVGVRSIGSMQHLSVFPNPAHGVLHINGLEQNGFATVLSAVGQVTLQGIVGAVNSELKISDLPAGSYVLMVADASGSVWKMHFVKL